MWNVEVAGQLISDWGTGPLLYPSGPLSTQRDMAWLQSLLLALRISRDIQQAAIGQIVLLCVTGKCCGHGIISFEQFHLWKWAPLPRTSKGDYG